MKQVMERHRKSLANDANVTSKGANIQVINEGMVPLDNRVGLGYTYSRLK